MANAKQFPRTLAVKVLTRVLSDQEPLDEVLNSLRQEVSAEEATWLQEVCSGTLRWKGRLDFALDSISLKKKPSGWLRKVLLVAAYQLVVQDRVPPAWVVSETVSLIKSKEGEAPARFANATLRKIADHALEWRNQEYPGQQVQVEVQAGWASLPEWLWKKLVKQKGEEWAKAFAKATLERPKLWIRSKGGAVDSTAIPGFLAGAWELPQGGSIVGREGFREGQFFVQDISSQFLVHEVTEKISAEWKGSPITALDLCAAPGGKAVGMAWDGFQVFATDYSQKRLTLLEENILRMKLESSNLQIVPWDQVDSLAATALVWVDAPCSGTGIIRRHPDVRWLRKESEIPGLSQIQLQLLQRGWEKVLPGGFLVYSVCSILDEEGPKVVKEAGLEKFTHHQWQLAPHLAPYGDGFWSALLKKPVL